jgi:hypothetical protein
MKPLEHRGRKYIGLIDTGFNWFRGLGVKYTGFRMFRMFRKFRIEPSIGGLI